MDIKSMIEATVHTDWRAVLLQLATMHGERINTALCKDAGAMLPPHDLIFNAFTKFNMADLKVVILGQDVYPTRGHGMGLCFSVSGVQNTNVNTNTTKMPPSLRNIFKELEHEYGVKRMSMDLTDWAEQGVLMLNTALTVLEGKAGKHISVWKPFTQDLLDYVVQNTEHVVYILWGEHAKDAVLPLFNEADRKEANKILTHSHPSPLARKPFVGNNHFEETNKYLESVGKSRIRWV